MPRQIKNDQISRSQLSDLVRDIVKSEIRRRDGALAGSLVIAPVPGGILTYNSSRELTTQYITTTGSVGSITVNIVADLDVVLTSGQNVQLQASGNLVTNATDWIANFNEGVEIIFNNNGTPASFRITDGATSTVLVELTPTNLDVTVDEDVIFTSVTKTFQVFAGTDIILDAQDYFTIGANNVQIYGVDVIYAFANNNFDVDSDGTLDLSCQTEMTIASGSSSVSMSAGTTISLTAVNDLTLTGDTNGGVTGPQMILASADAVLVGNYRSGTNQPGGTAHLRGGRPTGTGQSKAKIQITTNTPTVTTRIECDVNGIGFFGNTPIARPGTYTITAAPAAATALNCDANAGAAYVGVGTASVVDLNDLRADVQSLAAVVRQLIKHLGDTSGLGLIDETGY